MAGPRVLVLLWWVTGTLGATGSGSQSRHEPECVTGAVGLEHRDRDCAGHWYYHSGWQLLWHRDRRHVTGTAIRQRYDRDSDPPLAAGHYCQRHHHCASGRESVIMTVSL